jgi:hypothetical protein
MRRLFLVLSLSLPPVGAQTAPSADEYLEITADLDGNGIPDRLMSEPTRDFGMSGGSWEVFLGKKEGGFVFAGRIYAHPLALRVERLSDSVRLWVYLRSSGSSGILGYYELKDGRVGDLTKIEISPGDGGTDLGRTLYESVFPTAKRLMTVKKRPYQAPEPTAPSGRGSA